jgi:hypothetical protein
MKVSIYLLSHMLYSLLVPQILTNQEKPTSEISYI